MKKQAFKAVLALMAFCSAMGAASAQIGFGGVPPTFRETDNAKFLSPLEIEIVEHHLDIARLQREEREAAKWGQAPKIATRVEVDYNPSNAGKWEKLRNGTMVWRLALRLPDALAVIVSYSDLYLPAGASLFLYTPDRRRVLGAYTRETHPQGGSFSSEMIAGQTVVFELAAPPGTDSVRLPAFLEELRLQIDGLGFVFDKKTARHLPGRSQETNGKDVGDSEWCTVNINCPAGADWQETKKSVCRMLMYVNYSWYLCTGTLVNNTAQNIRPFIASAFHCLSGGDPNTIDFSQWQFIFDYEAPGCEDEEPENARTMIGCTYRAGIPQTGGSDGLLLELNDRIPESWGVYYSGWDRRNALPEDKTAVNIHHPAGDLKKISLLEELEVSRWPQHNAEGDYNAHLQIVYGNTLNGRSVTEGGSSGSGAFNNEHRLIATLTGGNTSCNNPYGNGYYGRFWYHWNRYGEDSTTQFSYWLDPLHTGAETLNGTYIDPAAKRIDLSRDALLPFRTENYLLPSASDTFSISTSNLTGPVLFWADEPFEVSGDGMGFDRSSQREGSGTVHVRYNPQAIRRDTGFVYLSSKGFDTIKVSVWGNSCQPLQLEPATLPYADFGSHYRIQLSASGSDAEYTYEITEGRLPEGLGLSSDGTISGTPSEHGLFTFSVRVAEPHLCDEYFNRSLYVRCNIISDFPYRESFENGHMPDCWTEEYGKDNVRWRFLNGMEGGECPVTSAFEGNGNAFFRAETFEGFSTRLITPQLDLSPLSHPALSFAYAQPVWITDQDELKVYVKNSATAAWRELMHITGNISHWKDTTVNLPEPSSEYFIAFEGLAYFGYGVAIDAVKVFENDVHNQHPDIRPAPTLTYGNPVSNPWPIAWDDRDWERIRIYDLLGRLVFQQEIKGKNAIEIPTETWQPGLYAVVLSSRNRNTGIKIIKATH